MISPCVRAALAAAVALLVACGDSPFRERERLRVAARSGATVDLSRTTWGPVCIELTPPRGNVQSVLRRIVHGDDGAVSYSDQGFGQPACAGGPPAEGSITWLATANGTRAVSWSGTKPAAAPGTPEFPDAPLATRVFLENQVALSGEVFWVDDVSSPRVLYASPDPSPADPADGYPSLISAVGFVEIP